MLLIGDIGNTETKICLVNSNNKIKKKNHFFFFEYKPGAIKKKI